MKRNSFLFSLLFLTLGITSNVFAAQSPWASFVELKSKTPANPEAQAKLEPKKSTEEQAPTDKTAKESATASPQANTNTTAEEMSAPVCPQGTFVVARLKSVAALDNAVEGFKGWVREHPSVEALFDDDEWKAVEHFDLRGTLSEYLELSRQDFDEFFEGAVTLCVDGDFKWAQANKMLPVVAEMTTHSPERAQEFATMLKAEDDVLETSTEAEGVERIRVKAPETNDEEKKLKSNNSQEGEKGKKSKKSENGFNKSAEDKTDKPVKPSNVVAKSSEPIDVYLAVVGAKVIVGNSLNYTVAARASAMNPTAGSNAFWERSTKADVALWMDPRPFLAMVKEQLEAKAKAENPEGPAKVDPEILEKLGFNEIEGVGLRVNLADKTEATPLQLQVEISYAPNPTGVAKLLTCTPTGLEPSTLIPADADEFSLSRMDIACLWSELRRLAKIAVPATDTMYEGWKKQIQETYGVSIEQQLFGAFGDRAVVYTCHDETRADSKAVYIAVNDAVSLQGGLDAFIGFFSQGKSPFEKQKEKVSGATVWRLKSENQSPEAPAIAYALTPQWLIVSFGDPTQIQDLIEAANSRTDRPVNKIFNEPQVKELLANPALVSFGCRPLKRVLSDISAAMIQVKQRQTKTTDETAPDAEEEEVPEFEDVAELLLISTQSTPGCVISTLKVMEKEK